MKLSLTLRKDNSPQPVFVCFAADEKPSPIRPSFLSFPPMIYFDYNATAPVMREAREAWLNVTEKIGGNPSSMHQAGTRASIALADAREKLAAFLGCHPLDIIWTSGATEANNMVTHHFAKTLGDKE